MALDNFDRVGALNAVIKAWTQYGSLPFILNKTIPAGGGILQFNVNDPSCFFVITFGMLNSETTVRLTRYESGTASTQVISSAADIGYTRSANRYTITNNSTSHNVKTYIIMLQGSAEEV